MIKKLFALSLVAIAWACSDQVDVNSVSPTDISAVDGRLVFKDEQAFVNAINELDGANAQRFSAMIKSLDYGSLGKRLGILTKESLPEDLKQYDDYASTHKLLLNGEGIVQLGNDVVKYKDGKKYYQDVSLFGLEDITKSDRIGYYTITGFAPKIDPNARNFDTQTNTGGAQYDFYYLPDNSMRKMVNEWLCYFESYGAQTPSPCWNTHTIGYNRGVLKLRMRLFGRTKASKPWTLAPDPRNLSWNISIRDFYMTYTDGSCTPQTTNVGPISTSGSIYDENSGSYEAPIYYSIYYQTTQPGYPGKFIGNAQGNAYQAHLHNDHSTVYFSWTDYMYWP